MTILTREAGDLNNSKDKDIDGDAIGDVCDTEESRLTEQYPWLPWSGIGAAALIIGALFYSTARKKSS